MKWLKSKIFVWHGVCFVHFADTEAGLMAEHFGEFTRNNKTPMKRISKKLWALPAAALALVLTATSSFAVPTIIIDFGDDGAFNAGIDQTYTSLTGLVTGTTAYGTMTVTATGTTKPMAGSATAPELATIALAIAGSGTVGIYFFDTDFGPTESGLNAEFAQTSLGVGGSATYSTYADQVNNAFSLFTGTGANAITVQTLTLLNPTGSSAFGTIPFDTTGSYSLLQKIVITQTGGVTGVSANLSVPDGGATAALLGLSFLGLAYVRNRFSLIKA